MGKKEYAALALGEILLRLSTPNNERIVRGDTFQKCAGGAELNVVSGIAALGLRTGIISKVPQNDLGVFVRNHIRFCGVSDDYLVYDKSKNSRLGIYYYENGAYPRKTSVVYDRAYSAINSLTVDDISEDVYSSTRLFHTSGISLALSKELRENVVEIIKKFKENGTKISFDVNFRANLWTEEEARETIETILPYVDILFASEETSRKMFKKTGDLKDVMKSYTTEYGVEIVATTERTIISPKKHHFNSIIYNAKEDCYYQEKPYENIEVVDRIGSGDAYVSGVLYGLLQYDSCEKALQFGNVVSALKNTIPGDVLSTNLNEVTRIMEEHSGQRAASELNR
ncbi:sugar kinase [Anaerosporobacter sp.]|uniref:sugar kinase n=1 Tax=Anaerosporobacter sp. TaxID=1872529 RepID=UPI00286FA003|nr:sugar kinase [Anaerosporobacter sp.]